MPLFTPVIGRCLLLFFITVSSIALYANAAPQLQPMPLNGLSAIPSKKLYDEDAKTWYAVYDTGNTVYVCLAITDPVQQKQIIINGIDLWIDTRGKKNKKTGILFPFTVQPERNNIIPPPPPANEQAGKIDHTLNDIPSLEKIIAAQREMKLTGFKEDLNGVQGIQHPSGIKVHLYFSKDTELYEAQLPLNTLDEPVSVNSHISIGIVEKGRDFSGSDGNMPMPPPADGMMPPPPGPEGMDGNGMQQFQDDTVWYKFFLNDTTEQ